MKFYMTFYNNLLNRPAYKYMLNLFFLKNNVGLPISHTLYPHFFINTKNLKIKFLKNNALNLYWSVITSAALVCFLLSLVFYIF